MGSDSTETISLACVLVLICPERSPQVNGWTIELPLMHCASFEACRQLECLNEMNSVMLMHKRIFEYLFSLALSLYGRTHTGWICAFSNTASLLKALLCFCNARFFLGVKQKRMSHVRLGSPHILDRAAQCWVFKRILALDLNGYNVVICEGKLLISIRLSWHAQIASVKDLENI